MSRSIPTTRWIAMGVILAFVGALSWSVLSSTGAGAQASGDATMELSVSEPSDGQTFRTIAVSIDPGTNSGMGALSASLSFDADDVVVTSCDVAEAGACNALADKVRLSVFNLGGIAANDQLMTVNFEAAPGATAETTFELIVETAVNFQGQELPEIIVAPVVVELVEARFGSLTGDIVDAESLTGLFGLDVCVASGETPTCTTSTGLGTWRIDDLLVGDYTVTIADPNGVYATAEVAATVTADQIVSGIDGELTLIANEPVEDADATSTDTQDPAPAEDTPAVVRAQDPPPVLIVYEASIAGRVTARDSQEMLEAVQVCATQPLVLHQSCATTDENGVFSLAGLSTGNYWVEVVDPLGRFEDSEPKLVGVIGDTTIRGGVQIRMDRIAN